MGYVAGTWGEYKAPFLFATNGRAYRKQLEASSGVWFRDARSDDNAPRVLRGWIGPRDLLDILESDIDAANRRLSEFSFDLLCDQDGLNLRPYQVEAIEKAEAAVASGQQTALLEMAAGTGKTRIVPGIIYRFLQTGRFKRILLLVDDTGPGGRAPDVFTDVIIDNQMPLDRIYEIQNLVDEGDDKGDDDDKDLDRDTRIQVSTVHTLFERIFLSGGEAVPPVTAYDLIIADDVHEGNGYHEVLDYFDATKIVLTANPGRHTAEIFGKPVFSYPHVSPATILSYNKG